MNTVFRFALNCLIPISMYVDVISNQTISIQIYFIKGNSGSRLGKSYFIYEKKIRFDFNCLIPFSILFYQGKLGSRLCKLRTRNWEIGLDIWPDTFNLRMGIFKCYSDRCCLNFDFLELTIENMLHLDPCCCEINYRMYFRM